MLVLIKDNMSKLRCLLFTINNSQFSNSGNLSCNTKSAILILPEALTVLAMILLSYKWVF